MAKNVKGMSRPVWGAWIEITWANTTTNATLTSRPVWGAWIEIWHQPSPSPPLPGRAPYGARGLKYISDLLSYKCYKSRPVWGAWIEMQVVTLAFRARGSRAPYGARGLKSVRLPISLHHYLVAPRMGRVD